MIEVTSEEELLDILNKDTISESSRTHIVIKDGFYKNTTIENSNLKIKLKSSATVYGLNIYGDNISIEGEYNSEIIGLEIDGNNISINNIDINTWYRKSLYRFFLTLKDSSNIKIENSCISAIIIDNSSNIKLNNVDIGQMSASQSNNINLCDINIENSIPSYEMLDINSIFNITNCKNINISNFEISIMSKDIQLFIKNSKYIFIERLYNDKPVKNLLKLVDSKCIINNFIPGKGENLLTGRNSNLDIKNITLDGFDYNEVIEGKNFNIKCPRLSLKCI